MTLQELLYEVNIVEVRGNLSTTIDRLQIDSRKADEGSCFIAIGGTGQDGHQFIDNAIRAGAVAVVCERLPERLPENVTFICVQDSSVAAGRISHNFFEGLLKN